MESATRKHWKDDNGSIVSKKHWPTHLYMKIQISFYHLLTIQNIIWFAFIIPTWFNYYEQCLLYLDYFQFCWFKWLEYKTNSFILYHLLKLNLITDLIINEYLDEIRWKCKLATLQFIKARFKFFITKHDYLSLSGWLNLFDSSIFFKIFPLKNHIISIRKYWNILNSTSRFAIKVLFILQLQLNVFLFQKSFCRLEQIYQM